MKIELKLLNVLNLLGLNKKRNWIIKDSSKDYKLVNFFRPHVKLSTFYLTILGPKFKFKTFKHKWYYTLIGRSTSETLQHCNCNR